MSVIAAVGALKEIPKRRVLDDEVLADEGIEIDANGTVSVRLPRLRSFMTKPDRVKVLAWHVREDELLPVSEDERDMIHLEYLGDDWYLPLPPFQCSMRVAGIRARVGTTIHLFDPLIMFEPVTPAA